MWSKILKSSPQNLVSSVEPGFQKITAKMKVSGSSSIRLQAEKKLKPADVAEETLCFGWIDSVVSRRQRSEALVGLDTGT
jgi:hypothetical protein